MTNKAEVIELLPCPFCGTEDAVVRSSRELNDNPTTTERFWVECANCDATPFLPERERAEAITTWNTRSPPIELVEDELVERVAKAIDDAWPEHFDIILSTRQLHRVARAAIASLGVGK